MNIHVVDRLVMIVAVRSWNYSRTWTLMSRFSFKWIVSFSLRCTTPLTGSTASSSCFQTTARLSEPLRPAHYFDLRESVWWLPCVWCYCCLAAVCVWCWDAVMRGGSICSPCCQFERQQKVKDKSIFRKLPRILSVDSVEVNLPWILLSL